MIELYSMYKSELLTDTLCICLLTDTESIPQYMFHIAARLLVNWGMKCQWKFYNWNSCLHRIRRFHWPTDTLLYTKYNHILSILNIIYICKNMKSNLPFHSNSDCSTDFNTAPSVEKQSLLGKSN